VRGRGGRPSPLCYNGAVRLTVRLFASYREAVGAPVVELHLDGGARVETLWPALVARYPSLARLPAPSGYAVNDEYVVGPRELLDGEEVALIPPVSGGASPDPAAEVQAPYVEITPEPISVDRLLREVADPGAGAVVVFLGVVRGHTRGRPVQHLTYEAYDALARRELQRIAAAITERWPVVRRVAIAHRTGRLGVGETSVAVAVSAPHRPEAFDAARFAIDTLKKTVPIWKKEVWEGGEAWVGSGA
jgi:molybdopterin synthase catalytic subunit/molybdopterin converting factor small subunit